jgi:hypothetical protein
VPCYHPPVPEAEPAAAARWLYGTIAGTEPRLPRRILAIAVVSLTVVVATALLLGSILGSLALLGVTVDRFAPAGPARGRAATSWLLVVFTTGAFVGIATGVSWSSRRRRGDRTDESERDDGGVEAGQPPSGGEVGTRPAP